MLKKQSGQALVTLLMFVSVATIITSGSIIASIVNTQATYKYSRGEEALTIAEAGADNAILRLLRDSAYAGETLAVGNGTATITVVGTSPKTITSEGVTDGYRRKIQVIGTLSTDFIVTSWSEID